MWKFCYTGDPQGNFLEPTLSCVNIFLGFSSFPLCPFPYQGPLPPNPRPSFTYTCLRDYSGFFLLPTLVVLNGESSRMRAFMFSGFAFAQCVWLRDLVWSYFHFLRVHHVSTPAASATRRLLQLSSVQEARLQIVIVCCNGSPA